MAEALTPMRKQYLEIKEQHPDCLLFFRLGDFYELFDEDAKIASKELDLTLTTRDRKKSAEERVPMCGVPYHSYQSYLARLVAKGYKVAICEQMEDPAEAQGIVERDVIRIVTPGTVVDAAMLDERSNNYIAAVYLTANRGGICFCDISTGELDCTAFSGDQTVQHLVNELGRFCPREAVLSEGAMEEELLTEVLKNRLNCQIERGDQTRFDYQQARETLDRQFDNPAAIPAGQAEAVRAVGGLLSYLYETQKNNLAHVRRLNYYTTGRYMELDWTARRNLELTETLRGKEKKGSLLWVLDRTRTAMGGRLLRSWIEKPLLNPVDIDRRLQAVNALVNNMVVREEVMLCLKEVTDLERLIGRIVYGSAGGRDLVALSAGLRNVPRLRDLLGRCQGSTLLSDICQRLDALEELTDLIDRAMVDEPPFTVREGGLIRDGYSEDVDYLRNVMAHGKDMVAEIETKTKEECGIKNIRIRYNKIFGYYIEVSRGQADLVPDSWVRKQTTVNSERFINQELKDLEHTILSAQDKITGIEYQLFNEVRQKVAEQVEAVQRTAEAVAEADALCSLAVVAAENGYCMPQVDDSDIIQITEGRHPVVEQMLKDSMFVPNDTFMDSGDDTVAIITGPNMAGKSTYMRQVALICLMAQIGSFVPAKQARIGVLDRIFTRIGAADDLSAGQSTFMVEMDEVADILKNATPKSLLILDEIGRGTSTYDGMSIARAVLEYCADKRRLGAKTLFATHYHELTDLEGQIPGVKNYNIAAKKRADDIIFLRKIVRGGADQSYGIEVAKLAGVPARVITRARTILAEMEKGEDTGKSVLEPQPQVPLDEQCCFGDIRAFEVAEELRGLDINTLTPIEALNLVYQWKQKV
ncbi:MAG: DNA mismatch repair protein MutS [Clostridiales bacterium]|nr:DNA mismatch repair protein MutS [Clostridiales bacterium]